MRSFIIIICCIISFFRVNAQQNVVLIIVDDLGKDYCGFYETHADTANMPVLRSLANKGLRFNNAWATPYCSSTRAITQTGRYGFRTGVGTVIGNNSSAELQTSEWSIAEVLKQHNVSYATACIGKWHLNLPTPIKYNWPNNQFGYDHYEGNFQGALTDFFNWTKIKM